MTTGIYFRYHQFRYMLEKSMIEFYKRLSLIIFYFLVLELQ